MFIEVESVKFLAPEGRHVCIKGEIAPSAPDERNVCGG